MVCRVAVFNDKPDLDEETMGRFRAWMKSQPGFKDAWHVRDTATGRAMSISLWEDMASVLAMKTRVFPGGAMGLKPDLVELFDEVKHF